jgi:hypothetical protein
MANTATPLHQSQSQKLDTILDKLQKSEKKGRWTEWATILIPSAIAIVTIAVGLIQHISTSAKTARQPFLEKQSSLCFQASEQAARLATTTDAAPWKKS